MPVFERQISVVKIYKRYTRKEGETYNLLDLQALWEKDGVVNGIKWIIKYTFIHINLHKT